MVYYILAEIKVKLFITNANQDTRLGQLGDDADAYINEQLQIFEAVLPVGVPDAQLQRLSNQLAIAFYYYYQNPDHPAQPVKDTKTEIKDYIRTHYRKESNNIEKTSWTGKTTGAITGLQ